MTTKASIVNRIATGVGCSKRTATIFVEAFLATLISDIGHEGIANLPGIGKFRVVDRAARPGRNPRTGEELRIPARKAVKFRPSASIKHLVRS
ncbi:MAG TPA: HU family DNA-binding protein [Methanosarcina sp.]|nr:HU family DNA-binding protein [Methanosarcina sp.]